jgi:CheY-like chemotaxis protein
MKKILIADASKASLVMTSEVFKDHFPGVHVLVARTSADALEIAKREEHIDACVIDFDLPDKDGAYTAAKIKKLFPIPVLITAFDRPDVQETIQRLCSAYDDCLSWLAKPVNSELVVSIAHRFIEGSYRTQRRIDCMIPAIAEVNIRTKGASKKSKSEGSGGVLAADAKICLPVMLEDCSVGGFKFRIMKRDILANKDFQFSSEGRLNIEEVITLLVPSFESIQTGEENVGYWLWDDKRGAAGSDGSKKQQKTANARPTLSTLRRSSRQALGDKSQEGQSIRGKSIWSTRVDGGDALIGIRSENMILSKKLFESALLGDNKIQARKTKLETHRERMRENEALAAAAKTESSESAKATPNSHSALGAPIARPKLEVISGSFAKNLPTPSPIGNGKVSNSKAQTQTERQKQKTPKLYAVKNTPEPDTNKAAQPLTPPLKAAPAIISKKKIIEPPKAIAKTPVKKALPKKSALASPKKAPAAARKTSTKAVSKNKKSAAPAKKTAPKAKAPSKTTIKTKTNVAKKTVSKALSTKKAKNSKKATTAAKGRKPARGGRHAS